MPGPGLRSPLVSYPKSDKKAPAPPPPRPVITNLPPPNQYDWVKKPPSTRR
jgi:hypothetical protein